MQITSAKNPLLQALRRAAATGRPTADGLIVAEGPHLLEEALNSQWRVAQVFGTADALDRYSALVHRVQSNVIEVSPKALSAAASTETTQEILSTLEPRHWRRDDLLGDCALIVALDGIQDPGNAGAIVRSAEAFGGTGVIFLNGSVRVSNAKLIRATAGSLFRIPFLEGVTSATLLQYVSRLGIQLYALAADGRTAISQADFKPPCIIIIGSEGSGVSSYLLAHSETVFIPMAKIESLNAAVASSIALFEADRQRRS